MLGNDAQVVAVGALDHHALDEVDQDLELLGGGIGAKQAGGDWALFRRSARGRTAMWWAYSCVRVRIYICIYIYILRDVTKEGVGERSE